MLFTTFSYIITSSMVRKAIYRPTLMRICVQHSFRAKREDKSPPNHRDHMCLCQPLQVFKAIIDSITDLWQRQFNFMTTALLRLTGSWFG